MSGLALANQLAALEFAKRVGFVTKVSPGRIESTGPAVTVGDACAIVDANTKAEEHPPLAEVASVDAGRVVLIPLDPTIVIRPNAKVIALPSLSSVPVGDAFAGRLVDATGAALDEAGPVLYEHRAPLDGRILAPLERRDPDRILETGVRALDGLLAIGRGQRIGIFAASGVGKTTLVRQLARQVDADRCVICLVGERGREVESLWREIEHGQRKRFTCVAATSEQSPVLRARAVRQAACLAEFWRDKGEHVLFVVDSVTRYAMALREIGLAAGEPPTLRAYTPSVFAALPRLVERCGGAKAGGSITGVMTVLSETDDVDDPIAETMKAAFDGHIVLSRTLAEQGHFPAIDVIRSVSRQAERLMAPQHASAARQIIALLSTYEEARIMISGGLYRPGNNPHLDEAVRTHGSIEDFLRQKGSEHSRLTTTVERLSALHARGSLHA